MAGPTVYTDVADVFDFASGGKLFADKKFWVAQRVTSRNRLLDYIRANGGEIVALEKKADYRIVDHARRDCPPGSTSYEFVEKSIKQGELLDPADYQAGPPLGEPPEAGAVHQPKKSGRAAFTAEEDGILYKWVRDAEAAGGSVSGNELYKQLAAKYPRHTGHSWRDRYLKQLWDRPPSAFNIPDNAPPSPPSDQSNERMPPAPALSKPAEQQTPKTEQASSARTLDKKGNSEANRDYSLEDLEIMFSTDDWLDLYAFAEIIDAVKGEDKYDSAWIGWTETRGKQTVEQWRQYYEKIVRPQWLRDPVSKRDKIRRRIEHKYDAENASASQTTGQQIQELEKPAETAVPPTAISPGASREDVDVVQPSALEGERFEDSLKDQQNDKLSPAYALYALEQKQNTLNAQPALDHAELDEILLTQWRSLSAAEKAPYIARHTSAMEDTLDELRNPAKNVSETKIPSSSTARQESPNFYDDQPARFGKRIRGFDVVEQQEEAELLPPVKRQKSESATSVQEDPPHPGRGEGTQNQPVEISSAVSSQSTSQPEDAEEPMQEQIRSEVLETVDDDATMVNLDEGTGEKEAESVESDEFPDIDELNPPSEQDSVLSNVLPSETPTPRASRQRTSNFDTQAILSSRTQNNFPQLQDYAPDEKYGQEQRFSSPAEHTDSDVSTTLSIEEFRRSRQEDPDQTLYSEPPPQPLRISSSPAPSTTSSSSEDPDPPLTGDEINDFYKELNDEGWSNDFISKALKRTGLRPELAARVLDVWKDGKPLPIERGIWSAEDDAAVESGDGTLLAKLKMKHTVDGWGGIMERLRFWQSYRDP